MRRGLFKIGLMSITCGVLAGGSSMAAEPEPTRFTLQADLTGYQEVPAVSTVAKGTFDAWIDTESGQIFYRLKYDGLEGTVTQSHVHFGQLSVNGGISFFLCTNLSNGPAGTQTCPEGPAVVDGVIDATSVIGPAATGIEAGAFAEIVAAIRNGTAYANVHSSKWPAGEIRGQVQVR
jgi:hypothetical protein